MHKELPIVWHKASVGYTAKLMSPSQGLTFILQLNPVSAMDHLNGWQLVITEQLPGATPQLRDAVTHYGDSSLHAVTLVGNEFKERWGLKQIGL